MKISTINKTATNNEANEKITSKTKIIFKPYIARGLLKRGHKMVDIKPYRDNPDRSIFVFEKTVQLLEDMRDIIKAHEQMVEATTAAANEEEKDA